MSDPIISDSQSIANGIYLEGLAVDTVRGVVWYSDVIGGGIHRLQPNGDTVNFNDDRMWTGGVLMNDDGSALSSGAGGIMWNNADSGESGWLLKQIEGSVLTGVNEMVPDGEGGIFFGSCDIEMVARGETPRATQIFRLTRDRTLIKVADDIGFSNGMMYDPGRRRFYCNDTFRGTWVFDVQPDLSLANKRILIEKEDADGMALDAEGNVWITGFRSGHIVRVSPDGKELAPVQTPAEAITQIRFGGADNCDIYINAVPIDGGDNLKDGEIPTEARSCMFKARSSVAGAVVPSASFDLA